MNTARMLLLVSVLATALGCGGNNAVTRTPAPEPATGRTVTTQITWAPANDPLYDDTTYLNVRILDAANFDSLGQQTIPRPTSGTTSTLTIPNVPEGDVIILFTGQNGPDGSAMPASISFSRTAATGDLSTEVSMASVPTTVEIMAFRDSGTTNMGSVLIVARDSDSKLVMVPTLDAGFTGLSFSSDPVPNFSLSNVSGGASFSGDWTGTVTIQGTLAWPNGPTLTESTTISR